MPLPSAETVQNLLSAGGNIRRRLLKIARRLEELNEYSREQALRVAADILHSKFATQTQTKSLQGEFS